MILESESGLTHAQYEALRDGYGDPTLRLTLEQYSPEFVIHDSDGNYGPHLFDACVCNGVIVRVYLDAGANDLLVETLSSEDIADQAWVQVHLVTAVASAVTPTVVGDISGGGANTTCRIFWVDTNGVIKYFENNASGIGGAPSWGAAQVCYDCSPQTIEFIAAPVLTRVHYVVHSAQNNHQIWSIEYVAAVWTQYDPYLYWPWQPESFDAVEGNQCDDGAWNPNDIVLVASYYPPLMGIKTEGVTITHTVEQVQGLAFFRAQCYNGFSEHYPFDVVDRAPTWPARYHAKLSKVPAETDFLFAAYSRMDGGPSDYSSGDYSHEGYALTRSRDGIYWELPTLTTNEGGLAPGVLLPRGNHLYLVGGYDTLRSPGVGYSGNPAVIKSITDNALQVTTSAEDVQQAQVILSNPGGILDTTSPIQDDVEMQLRMQLGYSVGGTDLLVQTSLLDVIAMGGDESLPADHIALSARDELGRLQSVAADQIFEEEGATTGGDDFAKKVVDMDGMRHTAPMEGGWKTSANQLWLDGPNQQAIANCTFVTDAMNGWCQAEFQCDANTEHNHAGLHFRAYNKDTFNVVYYDAHNDVVRLSTFRAGAETVIWTSGAMGWSPLTWYGLRVIYRYGRVNISYSTDLIAWLSLVTIEVPGSPDAMEYNWNSVTDGTMPLYSGRAGYFAQYFHDDSGGGGG